MPQVTLPDWPQNLVYFANWLDLSFALVGIILLILMIIWWRQQTPNWFRIVMGTFLISLLLCIRSYSLFVVPPYYVGCPAGCPGWRGFPLPLAKVAIDGTSSIGILDFLLNLLMLWLLWLGAALGWRLLAFAVEWWKRRWRFRLMFVLVVVVLPWALLPRILNPPQPSPTGEDLRLAVNARRSAEFTYRITGFWVQRLALEDLRHSAPSDQPEATFGKTVVNQVCLLGYTYFYIPWRRYRITLDPSGVTALSLTEVPLTGSCWGK